MHLQGGIPITEGFASKCSHTVRVYRHLMVTHHFNPQNVLDISGKYALIQQLSVVTPVLFLYAAYASSTWWLPLATGWRYPLWLCLVQSGLSLSQGLSTCEYTTSDYTVFVYCLFRGDPGMCPGWFEWWLLLAKVVQNVAFQHFLCSDGCAKVGG